MLQTSSSKNAVEAALSALVTAFKPAQANENTNELLGIIANEAEPFLTRFQQLENWLDAHTEFEPLADVMFDILMVQFLSAEMHPEDYFDTQEWNEIENKTLDRGSEMLNLFLYLSEAKDTEVEISLDDFLHEFLLVGEDEFQDEYRIYESLIIHEDILDASLDELRKVQQTVKEDTGMKDYFIPMVLFFQQTEDDSIPEKLTNSLSVIEKALLYSLIAYEQ